MKTLAPRMVGSFSPAVRTLAGKAGSTKRLDGNSWKPIRERVLARDAYMCVPCRDAGRPQMAHEVDHIVPIERGGSNADLNLQSICRKCHTNKTSREAKERSGFAA